MACCIGDTLSSAFCYSVSTSLWPNGISFFLPGSVFVATTQSSVNQFPSASLSLCFSVSPISIVFVLFSVFGCGHCFPCFVLFFFSSLFFCVFAIQNHIMVISTGSSPICTTTFTATEYDTHFLHQSPLSMISLLGPSLIHILSERRREAMERLFQSQHTCFVIAPVRVNFSFCLFCFLFDSIRFGRRKVLIADKKCDNSLAQRALLSLCICVRLKMRLVE